MISALKRLTKRQDDQKASPFPSGIAAIGQAMQKKFAKGVNYNMKIVIRGDRNTGKSCLLQRLQGKPFNPAYIPTQEIQAASINWNHKGGEDVVKVDVWDIVDKGEKKAQSKGLKISNEDGKLPDDVTLDADAIDVYKGTHGVIMLLDITKLWTWNYIERLLPRVPYHIPVLILANFRDMGEHRLVDVERMTAFIEHLDRPAGSAEVNFAESSMKDGFGLHYLYKFLNIPFLILQRETLLRQLEANALEIESVREELFYSMETEEQNYSKFIESIQSRNEKTAGTVSPSSDITETASESSPNISSNRMQDVANHVPDLTTPKLPPASARQSSVESSNKTGQERHYTAKLGINTALESQGKLDDFTPEDELDPAFLSDEKQKRWWSKASVKKQQPVPNNIDDSDEESDSDGGNPLVADFQDLTSDEDQPTPVMYKTEQPTTDKFTEQGRDSMEEDESDDLKQDLIAENPIKISGEEEAVKSTDGNSKNIEIEDKDIKKENVSDATDEPSDEEIEPSNHYEVAVDFDFEEPTLNNWLDDKDDDGRDEKSQTQTDLKETATAEEPVSDDLPKGRNQSFTIASEELDIFVNEQLRKVSISQEDEETEIKKTKKKKEKKQGTEGERKKKKKIVKDKDNIDEDEKQQRKKKPKATVNKKKKSSKRTSEPNDYELL